VGGPAAGPPAAHRAAARQTAACGAGRSGSCLARRVPAAGHWRSPPNQVGPGSRCWRAWRRRTAGRRASLACLAGTASLDGRLDAAAGAGRAGVAPPGRGEGRRAGSAGRWEVFCRVGAAPAAARPGTRCGVARQAGRQRRAAARAGQAAAAWGADGAAEEAGRWQGPGSFAGGILRCSWKPAGAIWHGNSLWRIREPTSRAAASQELLVFGARRWWRRLGKNGKGLPPGGSWCGWHHNRPAGGPRPAPQRRRACAPPTASRRGR
jgi:hypothetical protein